MITCVTWIPSNVAQEWPDKVHEIPLKHLPVQVDNFMPVEPEILKQFMDDDSDKSESSNEQEQDTDITPNKADSNTASRKRKFSELQNVESDKTNNPHTKKHKTNDGTQLTEEEDKDSYDADDDEEHAIKLIKTKITQLAKEEESDDDRFADIEDVDEFTHSVLKGYDDEPLDFISRIAGLHSGIGIGPTDYTYNTAKKTNTSREKRYRIISSENIHDTKNDSEIEDIHIKKTDEIFVCLGCDEDKTTSSMQVFVFDTELRTFYEHHDIVLPAFPLCSQWLSHGRFGSNLLAIGSVEESIEIFNLDVMDALEPVCSLGGRIATEEGSKLLSKWNEDIYFNYIEMNEDQKLVTLGELKEGSHSDPVLCLDWNTMNDNYLWSGSSDNSIKVWDLNRAECVRTMDYHEDKVQQIALKHNDPHILLSGGFDKNVFLYDFNQENEKKQFVNQWKMLEEVESLKWHPHNDNLFVCTMDNGYIQCYDIRKNVDEAVWSMKGHKKAVTSLSFHKEKEELFATSSLDKKIKLWYQKTSESKPKLLSEQSNDTMGGLFSIDFAPKRLISDILIVGGQEDFGVWDIMSDHNVKRVFDTNDDEKKDKESEANKDEPQHYIMEQTFNYKQGKRIVINTEDIDEFIDDD